MEARSEGAVSSAPTPVELEQPFEAVGLLHQRVDLAAVQVLYVAQAVADHGK